MKTAILIALDGSDASYNALDFTCDFANPSVTRLVLLHVVVGDTDSVSDSLQQRLSHLADEARKRGIEEVETAVVLGDPAEQIVSVAADKKCGSIVIGASGLGGGSPVGGCTERVLRKARMPVIVVP